MTATDQRLVRHLVTAIVLKLLALSLLWFFFVREHHVRVDSRRMAELASPSQMHPDPARQEVSHDQ